MIEPDHALTVVRDAAGWCAVCRCRWRSRTTMYASMCPTEWEAHLRELDYPRDTPSPPSA